MTSGALDVRYTFRSLVKTLGLLRAPDGTIEGLKNERVCKRAKDGYSLVRYIAQTGEETVAFTRSPFTPTIVQHPLRSSWALSSCGTDLEILDRQLGVTDITYSVAWQLGKTMALADHPFSAALARVKNHILEEGMKNPQTSARTDCSPCA